MPTISRNQIAIDRAQCVAGKRTVFYVDGVPGLELDVTPAGARTWRVAYQVGRGAERIKRRFTIGDARSIKLGAATDKANEIRSAVSLDGADPHAERMAPKGDTFGDLFAQWLDRHAKIKLRAWAADEALYERHVKSRLATARIAELRKRDVVEALNKISDASTLRQADACRALVSRVLGWGEKVDLVESNVARGIPEYGEKVERDRVLIDASGRKPDADKELARLWAAFDGETPQVARVLKLQALLGQRISELVGTKRDEIDFNVGVYTIPGKTPGDDGRTKNGLFHVVPLPPLAARLFKEACEESRHDVFVFPAINRGTMIDKPMGRHTPDHAFADICKALNVPDASIHDLRRTVNTGLVRIGVAPHVADAVLNHVSNKRGQTGVSHIYNRHEYQNEKRDALQRWEAELLRIVTAP